MTWVAQNRVVAPVPWSCRLCRCRNDRVVVVGGHLRNVVQACRCVRCGATFSIVTGPIVEVDT